MTSKSAARRIVRFRGDRGANAHLTPMRRSARNERVASSALHTGESGYRYGFDKPWGTNMDDEQPVPAPTTDPMTSAPAAPKVAARPAVKKKKKAAKKASPLGSGKTF